MLKDQIIKLRDEAKDDQEFFNNHGSENAASLFEGKKVAYNTVLDLIDKDETLKAMQEVCDKAIKAVDPKMIFIHGGNCICAHCELIRALDRLEGLK